MELVANQERQSERSVPREKNDDSTGLLQHELMNDKTLPHPAMIGAVSAGCVVGYAEACGAACVAGVQGVAISSFGKVDMTPTGSSMKSFPTNGFTDRKLVRILIVGSSFSLRRKKLLQELMNDITLPHPAMIGAVSAGCVVGYAEACGAACVAGVQGVAISSSGKVDMTPTGSSMKNFPTNFGSCMKEIFLRSECSTDDVSFEVSENGGLQEFLIKAWTKSNMQLWGMYHGDLVVTMKKGERPETENFINYSSKPERHSGSSQDDDAIFPENDRLLCKVCYMNELNIVFLPCSHMVACRRCAARLKTCPVCRSGIKEALPANLHE